MSIFNGEVTENLNPFQEYLDKAKENKIESIYNYEYKYIKEIIWDTEKQLKFGNKREGYERFNTKDKSVSYSGVSSLRTVTDSANNSPVIGYVLETRLTQNDAYLRMKEQYDLAKNKLYKILEVKDTESFDYWFEQIIGYPSSENSILSHIREFGNILEQYANDDEFRKFLDKIKG